MQTPEVACPTARAPFRRRKPWQRFCSRACRWRAWEKDHRRVPVVDSRPTAETKDQGPTSCTTRAATSRFALRQMERRFARLKRASYREPHDPLNDPQPHRPATPPRPRRRRCNPTPPAADSERRSPLDGGADVFAAPLERRAARSRHEAPYQIEPYLHGQLRMSDADVRGLLDRQPDAGIAIIHRSTFRSCRRGRGPTNGGDCARCSRRSVRACGSDWRRHSHLLQARGRPQSRAARTSRTGVDRKGDGGYVVAPPFRPPRHREGVRLAAGRRARSPTQMGTGVPPAPPPGRTARAPG